MRTRIILAFAGLAAMLVMALGVGTASASRLSFSHTVTRAIWSPLEFRGGSATTRCRVTLEQSFHCATIEKVSGALIGHVTRATVGRCETGSATVLRETLPWHIEYGGFSGSLPFPSVVKLRLVGVSFRISEPFFGIECLVTAAVEGILGSIRWDSMTGNGVIGTFGLSASEVPCGILRGRLEGTGTITDETGSEDVLIRLI